MESDLMYGIVSLLDDKHNGFVQDLWDEFKAKFGVHGVHRTPIPHFSYHVAQEYDLDAVRNLLMPIVRDLKPFTVQTTGLGIFTGKDPVLYVPVRRDAHIIQLHERIWRTIAESKAVIDSNTYYQPSQWHPHITLTHHDVDHDMLPKVIRVLSERQFAWEITIDNLAVLDGEDDVHTLEYKLEFGQ
jgi:2'-5' RNA ligase